MTKQPLSGVRVLEVGNYLAGPFCGMQLADLGADVIKIENPEGGDIVRHTAPFIGPESSSFLRLNRNKRSLGLNLKSTDGKEIFRRLVETADVVVENLRPGTMADLELDYQRLRAINRRLVYVAASGWGQDGPLSQLPGLDIMAQARSGLMSITGTDGGDPVKVGVPICDLACALYATIGALAALHVRAETGEGQLVDVCLFESGVSLAVWEAGKYFATREVPQPMGSAHQNLAPYQAIHSADGWFTVGATTPANWSGFCRALELEHLEQVEAYHDANGRFTNRDSLIPLIEAKTRTRNTAHWIARLEEAGVPCAPIHDYSQVFNDPHLLARGYFWDATDSMLGPIRQLGNPVRLSETPLRRERAAPRLGEDSVAVLTELGHPKGRIEDLIRRGVIGSPVTSETK
ncbi:MAG: CaiB/BaiF CoA transferase family protein [Candidatus Dormibacteraceae bacterium]